MEKSNARIHFSLLLDQKKKVECMTCYSKLFFLPFEFSRQKLIISLVL